MQRARLLPIVALTLLPGCSAYEQLFVERGDCNALSVYPSPLTVRVGQSTQLYGGLRDRYNRPVECLSNTPSWTLADSTIAAIDRRGLVTGLSVGTTRITGVSGSLSATAVVTVVAP
ncbi:Ig-like domain-containing protein [Gemmatimonas sp.]